METDKIITDTCSNLLQEIAQKEKILVKNVGIRIDLENENAKPVLSVFDQTRFLKRIFIKEIAKASGVGMMSGLISMSIGKIVQSIFKYGKQQYLIPTTKEIFLLIHLKHIPDNVQLNTAIALYIKGQMKETKLLSDILSQAQNR